MLGPRRSPPGAEWLEWCRLHQFLDAASLFPQKARGTWWHPRFGTEHVLDHVFFDCWQRWHLVACRTIHPVTPRNARDPWSWSTYTDHHPVVVILRQGKLWVPGGHNQVRVSRPDVAKLWGLGAPVLTMRHTFSEQIKQRLTEVGLLRAEN